MTWLLGTLFTCLAVLVQNSGRGPTINSHSQSIRTQMAFPQRFPREVVSLIGRFLPGLIIRPFGEDEVVTPQVNPAYCLLTKSAVQGFLSYRPPVQLRQADAVAPVPVQRRVGSNIECFPLDLDMTFVTSAPFVRLSLGTATLFEDISREAEQSDTDLPLSSGCLCEHRTWPRPSGVEAIPL